MIHYTQIKHIFNNIANQKIAIIGDIMLDKYVFGEVKRISPEAPVPIVTIKKEISILGGAANVAANIKTLGAEPLLISTLKEDNAGKEIYALLKLLNITHNYLTIDNRPTITKTRILGQKQQILRIDQEKIMDCTNSTIENLKNKITKALEYATVLIISDYAKGIIGCQIMEYIRKQCKDKKIPWIIDPKPKNIDLYNDATIMTPNITELAQLSNMPCDTNNDLIIASHHLLKKLNLSGLLVTRGEHGMTLFTSQSDTDPQFLAAEAKEVFDVSGAGDTVIALFSTLIANGIHWKKASILANMAAGIVVGKIGTSTVKVHEILNQYSSKKF